MTKKRRVLLTGATGFVGSHVYPLLCEDGFEVVCGSRDAAAASRSHRGREFVEVDLGQGASVSNALRDIDVAVYLVHGMRDGAGYDRLEKREAEIFAAAAARCGVERIVYLGALPPSGKPSKHLASRLRTGETLRSGPVPVVELQATMVIGGGSESFRIIRDLAGRLPIMPLPTWLDSVSEPVAVRDVAHAIVHALRIPLDRSVVLTAPGPERMSARSMVLRTAALMDHHPRSFRVPLVPPSLASYVIRACTRADARIATELVEGLRSDIVARTPSIWSRMPDYWRLGFDAACRQALEEEASNLPTRARLLEGVLRLVDW